MDMPAWTRVLLYLVTIGIAATAITIIVVIIAVALSPGSFYEIEHLAYSFHILAASSILISPAILVITWLFAVYIDRRPFETLGYAFRGTWVKEIVLGLALGFGLPALIFAFCCAMSWTRITGSLFALSPGMIMLTLAETLLGMLAVAFNEETIMRGYVLQNLKVRYGTLAALIVTTLLFSALHLANPGATIMALLGIVTAGFMLGYAYLATGRLWLPLAIHFGWNFALGPVLGFPVSGVDVPGWISQNVTGPDLWTGDIFGPEAGLLGFLAWVLGIVIIAWFARSIRRP